LEVSGTRQAQVPRFLESKIIAYTLAMILSDRGCLRLSA
jgi:hypothetical protein